MPVVLSSLMGLGALFCVGVMILRSRRDAVAFLTVFVVLLMLVPARLVLPGMGGIGTPATLLGLALLFWWVAGTLVPSLGFARGYNPVRVGLAVYVMAVLLSYALAPLRPLTDLEASGSDRALIALLAVVGVALLALDGIDSHKALDRLLSRVVGLGAIVASIGVLQFYLQLDVAPYIRPPGLVENSEVFSVKARSLFARPYATTLHPIEFAVVLATIFPIALQRALARQGQAMQWWRWGATSIIALSTMMAVSRSGILGLAVAGAVLAMAWSWRARLNALVLCLVFIGFVRATVPGLVGTLRNLFLNAEDDPSIQGRLDDVAQVRVLFPEAWLVGRGYGTWNSVENFVLDNEYYRSLLMVGLLGVLALFVFLGMLAMALRRVVRTTQRADTAGLAQALLAALAVQIVTMATFDGLAYPMFTGLLFLLAGVGGALWRLNERDRREATLLTPVNQDLAATP